MPGYKVNADFHINVSTLVEAENEEEALIIGKRQILEKDCEFQDPIDDPKMNWAELEE